MTYVVATIVFALAILAMAIGVIFGKTRIRGSCGGLAGLRDQHGNVLCEACSNPSPDCVGEPDRRNGEELQATREAAHADGGA